MRRIIAAAIGCLARTFLAPAASAQDWIVQGSPAEGWTGATACVPGQDGGITALCLSLGCETGRGPGATLSVSEAALPPQVDATITVDGGRAGVLDFRLDESGITYGAPLDGQDALVEALRMGSVAEVRLDHQGGRIVHPLSLGGSRAAIDAALAACLGQEMALPADLLGQPPETRSSADPVAEAIAENEAFCEDGVTKAEPNLSRRADVDGDATEDLLIDYAGLTCDGSLPFCGSGGCTQEIWLADPQGGYRLLVSSLIEEIVLPAPGAVLLLLDGAACGFAGAERCERTYAVRNGQLVLKR